ncbi:ParB/RepB/Spo0J family partition protein [Paracrocinitomix mangrovi]|uniref:ParB/RepB/Spo0J family partition protein n=1 Tax=Paracrocinitomix mangrovi TaxID=2862509 RepID=UPI001C8E8DEA|nr:ParB/RepB/Spo0J family partition protein [Paracrocinitomix mangrovi]UKN02597.1 ParB/RepB/Spo0J family partition protein [Paracrocinitomix mangrovi]
MAKKKALGKGLSALLESADSDVTTKSFGSERKVVGSVATIPIESIEANPWNPRTNFEEEALNELKESIENHGIIQPLTVRKLGRDKFQLISGERRFRAAQLAGLEEVPCYIRIANDQTMLEMALVENIQREDLNAIEVGLSYQRLIDECNLTQEKLSQKLGKSRSNITNFLRLLKLPVPIQVGIKEGLISMGHARALVSAGDEDTQINMFKKIIADGLSVRDVEALVKGRKSDSPVTAPAAKESYSFDEDVVAFSNRLAEKLSAKVQLSANNKGKGKLVINFDSEDQLNAIIEKIQA